MRVLWFTNTPSKASEEFNYKSFGGGWISSLETLLTGTKKYELGICFFYYGCNFRSISKDNVRYYGTPFQSGNVFRRIKSRHLTILDDEDPKHFDEIIEDFKPDIIHVFGTESGFGKILMNRSEKILFNIQGLIGPITDVYFPPGISKFKAFLRSDISSVIRGLTFMNKYKYFKKKAKREKLILNNFKYFIGRTEWDRNYVKLVNPGIKYFHCEEMLRQEFFKDIWAQPSILNTGDEIIIASIISSHPFKGLDLIYDAMNLLQEYKISWKIIGLDEDDLLNKIAKKRQKKNSEKHKIEFFGQIRANELVKQLITCHFYVHPSYMDNSSNSICEAMLLGMPVLASFVGGTKSLIQNWETGFLFNPYDKFDLAGLLIDLVNDYEKALYAGKFAREVALKRHSPEKILKELEGIYKYVFNEK